MPPQQTNATYNALIAAVSGPAAPPAGWAPLTNALGGIVSVADPNTGLTGQAFYNTSTNQVVIAFVGQYTVGAVVTGGLNGTPIQQAAAQTDGQIQQGKVPTAFQSAVSDFVGVVQAAADSKFHTTSSQLNIETTGSSLGGYASEYAAQQNGFGGTSYGGPGLIGYSVPTSGAATNFVSYAFAQDAIGMFGSDTGVIYPSNIGIFGTPGPHYGQFQMLGTTAEQQLLQSDLNNLAGGMPMDVLGIGAITSLEGLLSATHATHTSYADYFSNGTQPSISNVLGYPWEPAATAVARSHKRRRGFSGIIHVGRNCGEVREGGRVSLWGFIRRRADDSYPFVIASIAKRPRTARMTTGSLRYARDDGAIFLNSVDFEPFGHSQSASTANFRHTRRLPVANGSGRMSSFGVGVLQDRCHDVSLGFGGLG